MSEERSHDEDAVDLLTADLPAPLRAYARRLTTAMRLMAADAAGESTPSAGIHPGSAALELSARRAKRALAALEAVAWHLLGAALPAGSFLQVERPERGLGYTDAWRRLLGTLDGREERARLGLRIPGPSASADEALDGVLRAMSSLAAGAPRSIGARRLERLRLLAEALHAPERDLVRAFEGFAQQLHGAREGSASASRELRRGVLLDAIALVLDARRIRELGALLERVDAPPRDVASCRSAGDALVLLARWTAGWDEGAPFPRIADDRAADLGVRVAAWREIEALVDGGAGGADFALVEAGDRVAAARPEGLSVAGLDRRAAGARAVVVCRIDGASGRVVPVAADCAPGVRDAIGRWASRRRDALRERGAPEHEVARRARALGWSAASRDAGVLRVLGGACLGGARAAAAALFVLPLLDEAGEVRGIVWIECEHVLPPGYAVRARLARAGAALLAAEEQAVHGAPGRAAGPAPGRRLGPGAPRAVAAADHAGSLPGDPAVTRAWRRAIDALQLKLAERRWVAFHPRADVGGAAEFGSSASGAAESGAAEPGAVAIAMGGDGDLGAMGPGGGRIVERALRTGGSVRRDADGVFAGAQASAAIPVRLGRTVLAVLCIESSRRGDLREADVERWDAALAGSAPDIAVAVADARDRAEGHGGLALRPREPGAALTVPGLAALAGACAHLCFVGAPGAGRASLARLVGRIALLGGRGGQLHALAGSGLGADALERAFDGGGGDVVVVRDVDAVREGSLDRARAFASRSAAGRPRILMTGSGARPPALARALGAACVRVAPLRTRRVDVLPIARAIVARHAAPGATDGPVLEEAAEALLWRQPWPGDCDDLASVIGTAAVFAGGDGTIRVDAIASALADAGLEPLARLPSRDPDPRAVAAALLCTRTATQRINKARASSYLGWDPGTLAARLDDLGITDLADAESLLSPGAWPARAPSSPG